MADQKDDKATTETDSHRTVAATRVTRRPYKTPKVESYPLFERMALNCDVWMKNSGMDNHS